MKYHGYTPDSLLDKMYEQGKYVGRSTAFFDAEEAVGIVSFLIWVERNQ